nr:hypothetical protein [Geodermatophilaceae bacterium]
AHHLARAGDRQTALFRLERLAQHEQAPVRRAALEAMAATGAEAIPRFAALARQGEVPELRLEAARWLQARGAAPDLVRATLVALASQPAQGAIAHSAVELLGTQGDEAARAALLAIARHAPGADARLSAAEQLNQQGDTTAARSVLLTLAQGTDDLAAGAALDMLANLSDEVTDDTERLMNTATLKSVRRRAAAMLAQPHQPEPVQQAAARVFLALDRPNLARPILARLAQQAGDGPIRRWAAQQLALIGASALEEIRLTFARVDDPVAGQSLAEALLDHSPAPQDRRQAAAWLAEHSNLPRAVEVLAGIALSARVSGSDAVKATNDLNRFAERWAGAARALATLATDSPHPSARARALDLLLREHPSELPLSLLVDLAVTGSIGTGDRFPVMQQLSALAQPAATRIAARLTAEDIDTERRWYLLQLMNELPDSAAMPALLQLSAHAPQNRIRYVAAAQLVARGHASAGYATLATIAIDAPEAVLRERALYELAQGLPGTKELLQSILERTTYQDSFQLARELLYTQQRPLVRRANRWLDDLLARWDHWVARLPLTWLDRLVEALKR